MTLKDFFPYGWTFEYDGVEEFKVTRLDGEYLIVEQHEDSYGHALGLNFYRAPKDEHNPLDKSYQVEL